MYVTCFSDCVALCVCEAVRFTFLVSHIRRSDWYYEHRYVMRWPFFFLVLGIDLAIRKRASEMGVSSLDRCADCTLFVIYWFSWPETFGVGKSVLESGHCYWYAPCANPRNAFLRLARWDINPQVVQAAQQQLGVNLSAPSGLHHQVID